MDSRVRTISLMPLLPEEESIIGPDDDDGPDDSLPADLWFNGPARR